MNATVNATAASANIGFSHFISQSDGVGKFLLVVLLLMSMITWFVILNRVIGGRSIKSAMLRALDTMKNVGTAEQLKAVAAPAAGANADAFSRLASVALQSAEQRSALESGTGLSYSDYLTRSMRNCIDEETTKAETGLATLASIASSAPFVGLFGTVWGVYNALVSIGLSGQGTLDKVAGPVGEALIMTGLGLAVAIPAALAYNAFVRRNRLVSTKLNSFAHDIFAVLTKGR